MTSLFILQCLTKALGSLKHNPKIFCQKSFPYTSRDQIRWNISSVAVKFVRKMHLLRWNIEKNAKNRIKPACPEDLCSFQERNHTHTPFGSSPEDAANLLSGSSLILQPTACFSVSPIIYLSLWPYIHSRRKNFEVSATCSVCLEMQFA